MGQERRGGNHKLINPDQSAAAPADGSRKSTERAASVPAISWNMVSHFLSIADAESFKGATRTTGRSINTLRSHIEQLEHALGTVLFLRSCRGLTLTAAGHDFYAQAKLMRPPNPLSSRRIDRVMDRRGHAYALAPDELRLAVTEGLGTFWIIPRLSEYKKLAPDVRVKLDCRMASAEMNRRTIDLAVQLDRPSDPALICVKLGTLHLMPFASLDYIATHGSPGSIDEALGHRFVIQVAEQVRSDIFALYAGSTPPPQLVAMETNTSSAHYWAVANSVGIGILPTYARAITRRVIPLDMEIKLRRDIWLIYHPDVRRSRTHRHAIEWLRAAFDPRRYPWFAENFVHPHDFEQRFDDAEQNSTVVSLFAGFTEHDEM